MASAARLSSFPRCRLLAFNQQAASFGGFWIEGESADAACPLREATPLTNPFSDKNLLGSTGQVSVSELRTISAKSPADLRPISPDLFARR